MGNITNSFIGTTSFNTTVSPDGPLTWTVGTSTQQGSINSTQMNYVKTFYLGYPPSLDLAATSDFSSCALFFEGIAKSIALNGTSEYGSVTCGQTLGDGCVKDLLSQAQQQIQTLRDASGSSTESVCSSLQSSLQKQPPPSYLTGSLAPVDPIKQTSCHPSTGGAGYDIALVEKQEVTSEEVSSDNAPFFFSMTPILTVFFNPSGTKQSRNLPEAHLSCLKVVQDSALVQSTQSGVVMETPQLGRLAGVLVAVLSAIALV